MNDCKNYDLELFEEKAKTFVSAYCKRDSSEKVSARVIKVETASNGCIARLVAGDCLYTVFRNKFTKLWCLKKFTETFESVISEDAFPSI